MALIVRFSDDCYFDFDKHNLYFGENVIKENVGGIPYNIINFMTNHPEVVFKIDVLIESCWPSDATIESRSNSTVRSTISRIRNWHKDVNPHFKSIRGQGYKYTGTRQEDWNSIEKETHSIYPAENNDSANTSGTRSSSRGDAIKTIKTIASRARSLFSEEDLYDLIGKLLAELNKTDINVSELDEIYIDFYLERLQKEQPEINSQRIL